MTKASTRAGTSKGKQTKRFLEKTDALSLAASIAEEQEALSSTRAGKHHKIERVDQPKSDHKTTSNSKAKIKEKKTVIAAQRIKAKKERSKLRKERFKESKQDPAQRAAPSIDEKPEKAARKKVSFA